MLPTTLSAISSCCLSGLNKYDLCRAKIALWAEYILENRTKVSDECVLTRLENVGDCTQLSERDMDELWLLIVKAQTEILSSLETKETVTDVAYAATITTDSSTVQDDSVLNSTLSGNVTINAPTSPTDGKRIRYHLLASGGARTITLNAAIKTATGATFDATIASGSAMILELTYLKTRWVVTQNIEFVA